MEIGLLGGGVGGGGDGENERWCGVQSGDGNVDECKNPSTFNVLGKCTFLCTDYYIKANAQYCIIS